MIFTELATLKDPWRIYLTLPSVPVQDEATHEVESDDDDDIEISEVSSRGQSLLTTQVLRLVSG